MKYNHTKIINYQQQAEQWPQTGRHILAQFDDDSIIVYQAYRPAIGRYAVQHQQFGGEFSYQRMSWIKPNFLWMMYRCGWASKVGQEVVLAIRLKRDFFDQVLRLAVASSYPMANMLNSGINQTEWQTAVANSNVRLQWDPDHDPTGEKLPRKAIQLGLRNEILNNYGRDAVLEITDMTPFVHEQRQYAYSDQTQLLVPEERIYRPADQAAIDNVGLAEII